MKQLLPILMVFGVFLGSPGDSSALPQWERGSILHNDLLICLGQTSPSPKETPEKMIEDGMRIILSAIELILQSIPSIRHRKYWRTVTSSFVGFNQMGNHRAQEIREKRESDSFVIGIRLQRETTAARSDGV